MLALHAVITLASLAEPQAAPAVKSLGVLAVAPAPGPGAELVELTLQLRQVAVEAYPGALATPQLRERMTGSPSGAALADLDRAYQGARAAYLKGDFQGSRRALRALVDDLDRLPDGPDRFTQWTRAILRLARTELDLGNKPSALALIERLVRAAPDVEVERSLYPSGFVGLVENARGALRASPRRALVVTSSAEGSQVYVDGRDVGTTPLKLDLAQGRYRVAGAKGSTRVPSVPVELTDRDQEIHLDFALPEALRPSQGPGLALPDDDRPRWIVEAGKYLGLDQVLAVILLQETGTWYVAGSLHDVRRGGLLREARVRLSNMAIPAGGASALATFLLTGETMSPLVEYPGGPPPPPVTPPSGRGEVKPDTTSLTRPPIRFVGGTLGWTTLGVGVAALGLATYGLIETQSANGSYRRAEEMRSSGAVGSTAALAKYNGYIAEGDAARRRATVGWVGAGACALATGILGYVNYRRTGEVGPFRF